MWKELDCQTVRNSIVGMDPEAAKEMKLLRRIIKKILTTKAVMDIYAGYQGDHEHDLAVKHLVTCPECEKWFLEFAGNV